MKESNIMEKYSKPFVDIYASYLIAERSFYDYARAMHGRLFKESIAQCDINTALCEVGCKFDELTENEKIYANKMRYNLRVMLLEVDNHVYVNPFEDNYHRTILNKIDVK